MNTVFVVKDFLVEMTYDDAVVFLSKQGFRLATLDEWFSYRFEFPVDRCVWVEKPFGAGSFPVVKGSYYVGGECSDGVHWVAGTKVFPTCNKCKVKVGELRVFDMGESADTLCEECYEK